MDLNFDKILTIDFIFRFNLTTASDASISVKLFLVLDLGIATV